MDGSLLDGAPRLRVIGRAGTGLDNIDVVECRRRGVEVVYTPDANTQAVVEYVYALIADAIRPRRPVTTAVTAREWHQLRAQEHAGRQLASLTVGILGLGRIGSRVAEVARAFGARTAYFDLVPIAPDRRFGAVAVDPGTLFAESDVLTIHVDGRPANRGYVGADLLRGARPEAVLINTSRGFVVDNVALAEFLLAHPAAQAHLDVHDPEPFGPDHPLLDRPNARLYPHVASRTHTAMDAMSWVVRDVAAVLEGRPPKFPAPPPATG